MKQCSACKKSKPVEEFSVSRASRDGIQGKCKPCAAEYRRRWQKENPERARENSLKQTKKLIERNPAYFRQFYAKQYATEEGRARWIKNVQTRRARLANAEGEYTAEEFVELCLLYGGVCLACGRDDVRLTVDHVIPISKGGSNSIDNIQPLCKSCNCNKRDRIVDYRPDFAL